MFQLVGVGGLKRHVLLDFYLLKYVTEQAILYLWTFRDREMRLKPFIICNKNADLFHEIVINFNLRAIFFIFV